MMKPSWLFFLLLLLAAITCFTVTHTILTDTTPKYWDYADHITQSFRFYETIVFHKFPSFFTIYTFRPPFGYWVFTAILLLFGYSRLSVILFNLFFLFILLGTVCIYTKKVYGESAAWLAGIFSLAVLIQVYPHKDPFIPLVGIMLEIPLIVTTIISYVIILYGIRKKILTPLWGFLAGASFGIALLTKWYAPTLLLLPFAWYLVSCVKERKLISVCVAVFALCVTGLWWYILHFSDLTSAWSKWDITVTTFGDWRNSTIQYLPLMSIFLITGIYVLYGYIRAGVLTKKGHWMRIFYNNFTLQYLTVILSVAAIALLPIRSYRFIYPTVYLLYLVIFWNILEAVKAKPDRFVTGGILLYSALSVITFHPRISTGQFSLGRIQYFIENMKPVSLGVYFTDITSTFNHQNTQLLSREMYLFRKNTFHYSDINIIGIECQTSDPPDVLVVYSAYTSDVTFPERHKEFVEYCPASFRNLYQQFLQQQSDDGFVTFYRRRNIF